MTLVNGRFRWLAWALGIPISLFILVWLVSPAVIRPVITQTIAPYGLTLTPQSHIRLNLFRGRLSAKQVEFVKNNNTVASIDYLSLNVSLNQLLQHTIAFDDFTIEGVTVHSQISPDRMVIAGVDTTQLNTHTAEPATPQTQQASKVSVNINAIQLRNITFHTLINDDAFTLQLAKVEIQHLVANADTQSLQATIVGRLNDAALNMKLAIEASDEGIDITQRNILRGFDLSQLRVMGDPLLDNMTGTVDVDIDSTIHTDKRFQQFSIHTPALSIQAKDLSISPEQHLRTKVDNLTLLIHSASDIDLENVGNLQSHGDITAHIQGLHATTPDSVLVALDTFDMSPLQYSIAEQAVKLDLNTAELKLLTLSHTNNHAPLTTIEQLALSSLSFSKQHLSIEQLSLGTSAINMSLNDTGDIQELAPRLQSLITTTDDPQTTPPTDNTAAKDTNPPITVSLSQFTTRGPVSLHFVDHGVSPAVNQTWVLQSLALNHVDTRQPEQASTVALSLSDGRFARINADINATLLSQVPSGTIALDVTEVDLYPYSSYIASSLGIVIRAGQLDQNMAIALKNGQINGKTELHVRGLTLGSNQPIETAALATGTALSLNQALNLLKDKKGNIDLTIPLRGDTQSPEFGLQGFTELVIKKAVIRTAKSYLIDTFVPYASVVKLVAAGGSQLLKLRFEPLLLNARDNTFNEEQQQFIEQLAQLLSNNPNQQLRACPIASQQDHITVVSSFADQLKYQLVEQYQTSSSRVLLCTPKVDSGSDSLDRITFSFK